VPLCRWTHAGDATGDEWACIRCLASPGESSAVKVMLVMEQEKPARGCKRQMEGEGQVHRAKRVKLEEM
jgi:hypothetical protein